MGWYTRFFILVSFYLVLSILLTKIRIRHRHLVYMHILIKSNTYRYLYWPYFVFTTLAGSCLYIGQLASQGIDKPFDWYIYFVVVLTLCFIARSISRLSLEETLAYGIINSLFIVCLFTLFPALIYFSFLWITDPILIYESLFFDNFDIYMYDIINGLIYGTFIIIFIPLLLATMGEIIISSIITFFSKNNQKPSLVTEIRPYSEITKKYPNLFNDLLLKEFSISLALGGTVSFVIGVPLIGCILIISAGLIASVIYVTCPLCGSSE